jgi:hypothetical protein
MRNMDRYKDIPSQNVLTLGNSMNGANANINGNVNANRAGRFYSVGKSEDRFEMLAQKIQSCIQRNSERIEENVRTLSMWHQPRQ